MNGNGYTSVSLKIDTITHLKTYQSYLITKLGRYVTQSEAIDTAIRNGWDNDIDE